jgi:hypothetical protein
MKKYLFIIFLLLSSVTQATVYYVKNGGSDVAAGTSDGTAWATISKVNSVSFSAGDQVLFKRGSTWVGESLTPLTSGSSGNPIIFGAYDTGADPVISGASTLTGWTNYSGNIYYKALTVESTPNVLILDGVSQAMGRYPHSSYLLTENSSSTSAVDDALPASPDFDGGDIGIRTAEWVLERRTSITHSSHTLSYSATGYSSSVGNGFIVLNHISTLTNHGDWCYSGGNVYIYTTTAPSNYTIQVAAYDYTVEINSKDYITIQNIIFRGANQAAIYIASSDYVTIQDCVIEDQGNYGIYNTGASNYITVDGNTITYCNNVGISMDDSADHTTLTGNTISYIGYFFGMGGSSDQSYSGIICRGDYGNVEYNTITYTGYDGIAWGGQGTNIYRNFINYHCLYKGDGGGLYSYRDWNTSKTVSYNIILNGADNTATFSNDGVGIMEPTTHGIYNDGARSTTYTYNTCVGNYGAGILNNACKYNTITYNLFYDNQYQLYVTSESDANYYAEGHTITNNIMISRTLRTTPYEWMQSCFKLALIGISSYYDYSTTDYNAYCRPVSDNDYMDLWPNAWNWDPDPRLKYNLSEWVSYSGEDTHSTDTPSSTYSDDGDLHFIYNYSGTAVLYTLSATMVEGDGTSHSAGELSLPAWRGMVLIGDGTVELAGGSSTPTKRARYIGKFAHYQGKIGRY